MPGKARITALNEVRLAIVGAGGIAQTHARGLKQVKGARVTTVVDMIRDRAESLAEKLNADHVYEDIDTALDAGGFDAIDICLPTYLHAPVTVAAANRGYHVLSEKPMALTLEQADSMTAAARQKGIVLMIAQCRRYDNYWGAFRQAVQDGVIGRPVLWRSISAGPGPHQPWYFERDEGGGPLIDGAIHNYDFARAIFGEARSVYSAGQQFNLKNTALDTGSTTIRFASEDVLLLSWSWGMPQQVRSSFQDVIGPEGVLYLSQPAHAPKPTEEIPPNTGYLVVQRPGGSFEYIYYEKNDMYAAEIQAFVDAVREGRPSPLGPEDTKRSLAIATAVLESAATRQLICL